MTVGVVSPYDLSVPGGVQAQVLGLAAHIDRAGDLAVLIGPGLPADRRGVDLGPTVSLPGNRSRVPLALHPRVFGRMRAASAQVDVLHVHEPLMPLASWAALLSPLPLVATFHADPPPWARRMYWIGGPATRMILRRVAAVSAVSPTAASVLPSGLDVRIIPNGVDVAALAPVTDKVPGRVLFLGRDEPRKGLDVLLRAWDRVRRSRPDAELVVIGARRSEPGVRWMGRVDEATKRSVLASAAVLVAPQLGGESFGIVLVEGMAAGCAVLASDLEPFRAVAADAARYFPPGDDSALAAALVELLSDPTESERLARRGSQRAGGFDWAVVGPAYRALYAEALAE